MGFKHTVLGSSFCIIPVLVINYLTVDVIVTFLIITLCTGHQDIDYRYRYDVETRTKNYGSEIGHVDSVILVLGNRPNHRLCIVYSSPTFLSISMNLQ